MMRSLVVALIGVLALSTARAASEIVPVFDNASFRVGITLPFVVTAVKQDPDSRIHRLSVVDSAGTGQCLAMTDPKIPSNFVLKCDNVAKIQVKITVAKDAEAREIVYGPIEIKELKAGYREPKGPGGTNSDPEVAEGRAILYSKAQTGATGGRTCVGCHTTPGKYSKIMTASAVTLQTLSGNAYMLGVPSLTAAEAGKVIKYLRTLKDSGEWP